ncbi:hypothetical protein KY284_022151 [Solanum tuberosum]|nr:hypothetical protein KY284_022151 [Solanum tuberosum]
MVGKCRGLPLAIVVLSGLLSHKRRLDEWQKVKDCLWKDIEEDSIEISCILSLSFNDLSAALKQCFLYFGIFPEDQVIQANNIIRLWMAEGFIIPRGEERMEAVAEGFLNELIRRSLVQVAKTFWGKMLLYLDIKGGVIADAIGSLYHLKLLKLRGIHKLPSSIGNLKDLQTLVVVNEDGSFSQLPRETADLINLRHLSAPYLEPLKHISKLTSLQVLKDIYCDQWKDVDPVDLVNLRELGMDNISKSYSLNNISSLKNLSTLRLFCKYDGSFPSLEFVNCCEKLQKLFLYGRIEELPHLFPNSITMMILLKSKLMEDPMPILGMLPNLRNLGLLYAYEGKEIMCSDNSFSQLELLTLNDLYNL